MSGDRGKLIALSVVLLLLVSCGLCVCTGLGWVIASAPEEGLATEEAVRQGELDGRNGTSERCLGHGYERAEACGGLALACQDIARSYLLACLRNVPEPSPGLCDGAPAYPGLIPDMAFTESVCLPRGWSPDGLGCMVVEEALETHCAAIGRGTDGT